METSAKASLTPSLIIFNADIRTMDDNAPHAEAIAIFDNKIVAVGRSKEIRELAGKQTRVIDADGRLVLPGFNDAHVHFLSGGFQLSNVSLRDAQSTDELARRIESHAKKIPAGRWITGGEWDHEQWPDTPLPSKDMIDAVTLDNPVFVQRTDGHMALANSLALKIAGITRETKDVPGGLLVRDARGEPTGVLKDAAMPLVEKFIPEPSFEEKVSAARAASEYAASLGVTSVQEMSTDRDVGVYQTLLERGGLKTRIYAMRSIVSWEVLAKTGIHMNFGNDMLRIGGLKGFSDGSLGSSTALFFDPYSDQSDNRGILFDQMLPEGIMLERVLAADRAGFHVMIHAIGDEVNYRILEIYRQAAAQNGPRDRRFRIEHAQHLRPQDILRFAAQGVIPSMQPYHAIDDGRWCERRIGTERAKTTYAIRSLLDSGARVAFGTDWTVAPLNPMLSIYAAVTRRTLDGRNPGGWIPEQKISVAEAVRCYTVNSAYAEFSENAKGTLTPGKLADLVMLDKNIFTIDPVEIETARAVLTIVDGKVAFEAI
jgi:predicted amidohydrolase YtcJ